MSAYLTTLDRENLVVRSPSLAENVLESLKIYPPAAQNRQPYVSIVSGLSGTILPSQIWKKDLIHNGANVDGKSKSIGSL